MALFSELCIQDGQIKPDKLNKTLKYSVTGFGACFVAIGAASTGADPPEQCLHVQDSANIDVYIQSTSADGNATIVLKNSKDKWNLINSGTGAGSFILQSGGTDLLTATSGGYISFKTGGCINEFSTDGTLGDDSDNAVATEKAIKTYVDACLVSAVPDYLSTICVSGCATGISPDSESDVLYFCNGSNVTITPDSTNGGITVAINSALSLTTMCATSCISLPTSCAVTSVDTPQTCASTCITGPVVCATTVQCGCIVTPILSAITCISGAEACATTLMNTACSCATACIGAALLSTTNITSTGTSTLGNVLYTAAGCTLCYAEINVNCLTPANDCPTGNLSFLGCDSGGSPQAYALICGIAKSVATTAECGNMYIQVACGGSLINSISLTFECTVFAKNLCAVAVSIFDDDTCVTACHITPCHVASTSMCTPHLTVGCITMASCGCVVASPGADGHAIPKCYVDNSVFSSGICNVQHITCAHKGVPPITQVDVSKSDIIFRGNWGAMGCCPAGCNCNTAWYGIRVLLCCNGCCVRFDSCTDFNCGPSVLCHGVSIRQWC